MNHEWALWAAEQTRLRGEAKPEGIGVGEVENVAEVENEETAKAAAEAAAENGNEEPAKERGGEKNRPNQKA
jgi:hypothetical protein